MAGKKNKQSREERLRKKREAERKRYEKLKNNPKKLEEEKMKWKTKYNARKSKGTVKLIKNQSARDQRATRLKWRERQRKHRTRKSIQQQANCNINEDILPDSDPDDPSQNFDYQAISTADVSQTPENRSELGNVSSAISDGRKIESKKRRRRNDTRKCREIKKLKLDLETYQKKADKYRKQYQRVKAKTNQKEKKESQVKDMTPETKINHFLQGRRIDKDIRRKLFTGEIIRAQLADTISSIKSYKTKRILKTSLVGKIIKKYRMQSAFPFMRIPAAVTKYKKKKDEIRNMVNYFFNDDENTTLSPGKKDFITRKKIKKQKRYLNTTMKELHKRFKTKNRGVRISYSFFCKLRPFWVVKPTLQSRDTCLCIIHHNIEMLVDKLNKCKVISSQKPEQLAETLCCEKDKEPCLLRRCSTCAERIITYNEFISDDTFTYQKWNLHKETRTIRGKEKTVTVIKKDKVISTIGKAVEELEISIKKFMTHIANIKHQHMYIKELKENLTCEDVLIHIDFSENYALKYASEVQSMHFGASREQITLHTGVAYHKTDSTSKPISFCTLSKSTRHDACAIWAHLEPVLLHLLQNERISAIHFLSDSPSTQYRNKKNFYLLEKYIKMRFPTIKRITWNFTEVGHGKGAPDGVGGCLKRTADKVVSMGCDVNNIDVLVKILKEHCPNILLWVVEEDNINKMDSFLSSATETLKAIKGTMKVHQVTAELRDTETKINYRTLSCHLCKAEENCMHYGIYFSRSSDAIQTQLYNVGDWVIFYYESEIFPGEITELGGGKARINSMEAKNINRTTWCWPKKEDIHEYLLEDVIRKISPPQPIGSSYRVTNFYFCDNF